jgi:hypothetical protein
MQAQKIKLHCLKNPVRQTNIDSYSPLPKRREAAVQAFPKPKINF